MTNERLRTVFERYYARLHDDDHSRLGTGMSPELRHVLTMLPKAAQFVEDGRRDKAMRWLGFIQGVLWTQKIYTIDELKLHNAPLNTLMPVCAVCGEPATCIGAYEGAEEETPACDKCCGHGCEDGKCRPIADE